jgi:hypothetical protein
MAAVAPRGTASGVCRHTVPGAPCRGEFSGLNTFSLMCLLFTLREHSSHASSPCFGQLKGS